MTTAALSSGELDTNKQPRPVPEKGLSRPTPQRAKRPRDKKPSVAERREVAGARALSLTTPPNPPLQLGTLLIGAGIGAAITLSVVVLDGRRGRRSALRAAITKSVAYAIARTSSPGSLVNLVARAVGSALA